MREKLEDARDRLEDLRKVEAEIEGFGDYLPGDYRIADPVGARNEAREHAATLLREIAKELAAKVCPENVFGVAPVLARIHAAETWLAGGQATHAQREVESALAFLWKEL